MQNMQPESSPAEPTDSHPVLKWRQLFTFVLMFALAACPLAMVYLLGHLLIEHPHAPPGIRIPFVLAIVLLLYISGYILFHLLVVPLRRKLMRGHFFATREETAIERNAVNERMGAGKPFLPQAGYWSVLYCILALFVLGSITSFAAAFDTCGCPDSGKLRTVLFLLAATLLFFPAFFAFVTLRRKSNTGTICQARKNWPLPVPNVPHPNRCGSAFCCR